MHAAPAILVGKWNIPPCVLPKPEGELVVPESIDGHKITKIEPWAFRGCDKMTKIVLPRYLEKVGDPLFRGCTALSSIEIAKDNPSFTSKNGALYSKDLKTLFVYPKAVDEIKLDAKTTEVAGHAFDSCRFRTVKVPASVKKLGWFAFACCPNLEVAEIPKSLESFSVAVFGENPKMKKVIIHGDAPETPKVTIWNGLKKDLFFNTSKDVVVEVDRGSKGWAGPGSTTLPERWPLNSEDSRPIRYIDDGKKK